MSGSGTASTAEVDLDVVICTYNNAGTLDRALAHLAEQEVPDDHRWRVLVVDNNCTDDTSERVEKHLREARIPGLRRVVEPEQGKGPAMVRGVHETSADWVAFVDDDCLLERDWIAGAIGFSRTARDAGAFGGRVELLFESPPPDGIAAYATLFAAQQHGDEPAETNSLVGAGMVLHRSSLERTGWLDGPLLGDRVGTKLGACGDLEIMLRLRALDLMLYYTPDLHLRHAIPAHRLTPSYLQRLAIGLGTGTVLAAAMTSGDRRLAWLRDALRLTSRLTLRAGKRSLESVRGRRTRLCARVDRAYALGAWIAVTDLLRLDRERRHALVTSARGVTFPSWWL